MGAVAIPDLSGLLDKTVNVQDLLIGVGAGAAAGLGTKWVSNKYLSQYIPAGVRPFLPALNGVVTGVALAFIAKKAGYGSKANALMAGAIAGGVAVTGWAFLASQFPQLSDVVDVQLAEYNGVIVDDPGPNMQNYGVLIEDKAPRLSAYADEENMQELAEASMDDEDYAEVSAFAQY